MRYIKGIITLFCMIALSGSAFAQMGAAQKINWDVEHEVTIKVDRDDAWGALSNLKDLVRYANGYITSAEVKGIDAPLERTLTFSNGTKRTEDITQLDRTHKFLVIELKGVNAPKGITRVTIAVYTKDLDQKGTKISWLAVIEGEGGAKKELAAKLKAEFEQYAIGLTRSLVKAN